MALPSTLSSCPLFSPLPGRVLASLAPCFHERTLAPGERLFRAGDPADTFVVVHQGGLSLTRPDRAPFLLGPDAFLGVANLLEPGLHQATVCATEATTLSTFNRQDLDRLWRNNPSGAAFFHLALASRLITLLRAANERLVKLCELPLDHEGLRMALTVCDDALDDHAP
jgi:CRP-like cAMP-binding protein